MRPGASQLALRFDAAPPAPAACWREGAGLPYLGGQLLLRLATDRVAPAREDATLHLPLPPAATPRQIQDGVEAWLRQEAAHLIGASLTRQAAGLGRPVPRWALSFAARGDWVLQHADGSLRVNWRLIEQPPALIEQTLHRALAALPTGGATADFFAMQSA